MGNPNQLDLGGMTIVCTDIVLASTPGGAQTSLSATEIAALDGVTAGTVSASKAVIVDSSTNIAGFGTIASGAHAITSASASALAVGLTGATNSAFKVDASTASQVAGLKVTGAVTGGTVAVAATDSGADANLTVNAKGAGTIGIGSVSTGAVTITPATTVTGLITATGGVSIPAAKNVSIGAGSTAVPPIQLAAGTNLTTPVAGAIEYDGKVFYNDFAASQRALSVTEQFIYLTSPYTLTSQTTVQKLFNAPTGGALTVLGTTTYQFECLISMSSMSATSGNFKFDLLGAGNATLTASAWHAVGQDAATLGTAGTISGSYTVGTTTSVSSGDIITATTATNAYVYIRGAVRINAAGTLIPSCLLTTAAAAVVGADSWFRIWPVGAATVQSVGNWA